MTGAIGTYLGREELLERLTELLGAAAEGQGAFVVIRGAAGSGTTTTARLIGERAPAKGAVTHAGAFVEGVRGRPFGALADVLDERATSAGAPALYAELADGAPALARIAPQIRATLSAVPPPAPLDAPDERLRLLDAYAGWIQRAARRQPLLLLLDDLQWADADATALLRHLLPTLPNLPVLLLATWADYRGPAAVAAGAQVAGEPAAALLDEARVLEVPGLDKGATAALLTRAAGRPISAEALALVQQHSSGQPLPALELYRHLVEEGHVGRPGGDQLPDADQLPRRLEDIVAWRTARLAPESRSALGALACFAGGATPLLIAPVAGLTRTRVVDALEPAVAAGLVEIDEADRRYRLAHDRIRRAVLAALDPQLRAAAYRRAAEVLDAEAGTDSRQQSAQHADLWLRAAAADGADGADDAQTGLRHLLLAAEQARACAAYGRAAMILAAARVLVGRGGSADDVRERLLQAQAEAGDGDGVLATTAVLVSDDDRRGNTTRRRLQLGPLVEAARLLRAHGLPDHVAPLEQLAREAAGTPDRLAGARLDLLAEHWQPATDGVPVAIWTMGDGRTDQVILAEGDETDRAELFAPQRPRTHERTVGLLGLSRGFRRPASLLAALRGACADLTTRLGRWQEASSWANQYLTAAERYGSVRHAAEAQLYLARCRAVMGELDGAADALASADEIIGRLGDAANASVKAELRDASVLAAFTLAHYHDGDWPALLDRAAAAVARGPRPASLALAAESAVAATRLDDEGQARPRIEATLDTLERWPPLTYLRDEALLTTLTSGWELGWAVHTVRGLALLEQAANAGVSSNHATTIGLAAARLHGLVGRVDEARARFAAERPALFTAGLRPLRAIADHDEGIVLAAVADVHVVEADALLRRALEQFDELGMTGWSARTQRLLEGSFADARAPGGRLHFTYPLGLSRREVDLVRLLSAGTQLADAATALDLDAATAKRHLAGALAKLGSDDPADLPRLARRHGLGGIS